MPSNFGQLKGEIDRKFKWFNWLMTGVVIVVAVGFIAMLLTAGALINDSIAEKKATSQDIRDQINSQNDRIDALTEELRKANEQETIQQTD